MMCNIHYAIFTFTPTATITPSLTPTTPPPPFTGATFVYDGDGRRVAQTVNGVTTYFVGGHYEVTGSQVTKYYFAGTTRIAMRKYTIPQNMSVEYFLGDHLGSTSITTDANGAKVSEMRYKAWGEVRYATPNSTLPTRYTYTGQYSHINDEATDLGSAGFGLMFYNARWHDPALGRFIQPDSIVPSATQGVQAWDRFAYTNNNPVLYTDPNGHSIRPPICWLCGLTFSYASAGGPFAADGFLNSVLDMAITAVGSLYPGGVEVNPLADTATFPSEEEYYPALANNYVIIGADVAIPNNLYAVGNTVKPRAPRIEGYNYSGQYPDMFIDSNGLVIPGQGGASTFETIEQLAENVSGNGVYQLPQGSSIPGFDDIADGIPFGSQPPGHHSLVPNRPETPAELIELFNNLPWKQILTPDKKPLKLK
jgi:RHS repeat-associated protein